MNLAKVESPLLKEPACCRMCQAAHDREWFIDLGYLEDFWGAVYYCNLCFDELAVAAGYAPKRIFQDQKTQYYEELELIKAARWETSGAVNILRDAGFDLVAFVTWLRSVASGETNIELPERETSMASGETGTDESSDGERPDDASVLELNF